MRISASPEELNPQAAKEVIELILENNLRVPRKDIRFYVSSAAATGQKKMAQMFLDKVRE